MEVRSPDVWSGVFPGVSRLCILVGMDVRSLGVWSGVFPGVSRLCILVGMDVRSLVSGLVCSLALVGNIFFW